MAELEDAPWATGGGGSELPDAPWAKPAPKSYAWSDVPGAALQNAPHSAVEFGKNLVQPIIHPIDTAKSLAGIAGGAAEKVSPQVAAGLGPAGAIVSGIGAASRYLGGNQGAADAFGKFVKDRYGGVEELKRTLAEDPVGSAGDLSAILTGGGSAASRLPGIAGRVGEGVAATGRVIDPLRPVTKGIEKVGEKIAPLVPWRREMGVRLSEGERSEDLLKIQREQAALRGQSGAAAQKLADEFFNQQRPRELEAAERKLAQEFDPVHGTPVPGPRGGRSKLKGQVLAETPHEAGEMVSRGVQQTYAMRRKVVNDYYNDAERWGGEIHPDFFDDIGTRIKDNLSSRSTPVLVDEKLTPYANAALRDVETEISRLRAGTAGMPGGTPARGSIVGISLTGVNVMRQRLAAFRDSAFASGNAADGRAAQAVLRSFEDEIHGAVKGPAFKGDPRAVTAWDAARAAHADVRATFGPGRRDPAGQNMEKILGQRGSAPAHANDVIDMIMPAGLNPSTTHVQTAERVKRALGESSPEWIALRDGAFSRLRETPPGVKDWGPGKVADRINKFLNGDGRELAQVLFTPKQREALQRYADLRRKMQIPQAGANWSNSATFVQRSVDRALPWLTGAAGIGLAHMVAPGVPYFIAEGVGGYLGRGVGAKIAKRRADKRELKAVAPQLPIVNRKRKPVLERLRGPVSERLQDLPKARLRASQFIGRYTSPVSNPYQP